MLPNDELPWRKPVPHETLNKACAGVVLAVAFAAFAYGAIVVGPLVASEAEKTVAAFFAPVAQRIADDRERFAGFWRSLRR